MTKPFTPEQAHDLAVAFHRGEPLACPRCSVLLDERPVPPRSDVSYVRDRLWLVCPTCHATLVLDRRERPS